MSIDVRMRDFQRLTETLSVAQPGGFEFYRIGGVEEAVASAAFDDPEAILLDLTRPDTKGLASVIHVSNAFPGTPVIVITSVRDRLLAESAVALGARGYVSGTTISVPALLGVLQAALSDRVAGSNIPAADSA